MTQTIDTPQILLVDDEPVNLNLLHRLLGKDYRLMSARDGTTATKLLGQFGFDLVLLDIMLPDTSGLEVLKIIRSFTAATDLPVILLSALSDSANVASGLRLGANDYLTKPISVEVLLARVQTQLALKQLHDERKQTIADLQALQEMKEKFFRIAAHDLKSPLANISMANFLLRDLVGEHQEASRMLDMIDQCSDNMQIVIRDVLDTSAIQTGKLDVLHETVFVNDTMTDLVSQYQLSAYKKNITLSQDYTDDTVCGDPARFAQALDNLLSNAIKYSPCGTTITLSSEQRDGCVRICVSDQGPGIPEHERDRLFTQFGKLSTRPTQGESSTGLGLWIVKHLVTLQGGQVGVESVPGAGATFWLEMPTAAASEARCDPAHVSP
jgi:two-component system, sensor histidine kinase and response regulator